MSDTYVHIGQQPITVQDVVYENGATIVAEPEDMAFFLQIGAVEKQDAPKPVAPVRDEEEA